MKANLIFLMILFAAVFGLMGCEDLPVVDSNTDTGANKVIQGQVRDLGTGGVVQNASVELTFGGSSSGVTTGSDGVFRFEVNLNTSSDDGAQIVVTKAGFIQKIVNFTVVSDTNLVVAMSVDFSTSTWVKGVLRDSVTSFPLRNALILLTLPGVVDQYVTAVDGKFVMAANLVDRESMPIRLTTVLDGYKVKTITVTCFRGDTTDLQNVFLQVDAGSSIGQVSGHVLDFITNLPVNNATVVLTTPIFVDSQATGGDGLYSFAVDLQGLAGVSGTIRVSKNGYSTSTFNFTVNAGQIVNRDVQLERDTTTGVPPDPNGTGDARSIAFVNLSTNQISVAGVGGMESAIITWEVRDSLGFPIDIDHSDTVFFQLVGTPMFGGAYVSPSSALTNVAGRVATTINSGTVSGVLQFIATLRRESDGALISSTPAVITVNAGHPDQSHFSIGAEKLNFPALDWVGRTNEIGVQVGDKYSNPVKVNTAVYFNTTGGVIEASGFTNATSHTDVTLYSGNPLPFDPFLGPGWAWIRAYTLGENSVTVADSIPILFTGRAILTLAATVVHVDSGQCTEVLITLADRNGNPLGAGTVITTAVQFTPPEGENWSVLVSGMPDLPLGDYTAPGPGTTQFTLKICDGTPGGTPLPMAFSIKISTSGPNGILTADITGVVGPP